MEPAPRRRSSLLEAVFEAFTDAVFVRDLQGRCLLINSAGARLVGKTAAEMVGKFPQDLVPTETRRVFDNEDRRVLETGETLTYEAAAEVGGGMRTFLVTQDLLRNAAGKPVGILGIARDVTERRHVEAALQESEERLRLFIEHAPAALAMFDRDMRYLAVSRRWLADYGLRDQKIIGRSHYAVFPEIPARWKAVHQRGLAGEIVRAEEDRFERADGTVQWLRWEVRPWHAATGAVGGVVIFTEDISERKRAETALQESEALFQSLCASSPLGVFVTDLDGKVTYANPRCENLLGLPRARMQNEGWTLTIHPEDRERLLQDRRVALREVSEYSSEFRTVTEHGGVRWLGVRSAPMRDKGGQLIGRVGTLQDITESKLEAVQRDMLIAELRATNKRLHQLAQQLLTVEEDQRRHISRELHDETGQSLTALKITLAILAEGLTAESPDWRRRLADALALTDSTIQQTRRLAHELRPPALETIPLNDCLDVMCREFARRTGLAVEYAGCDLPELPDAINICLYRVLQEALTNVAKHARAHRVRVALRPEGAMLSLAVEDDGVGIPEQARRSAGIGLLGMRERAEILGGQLVVEALPGQGTRLLITIRSRAPR